MNVYRNILSVIKNQNVMFDKFNGKMVKNVKMKGRGADSRSFPRLGS